MKTRITLSLFLISALLGATTTFAQDSRQLPADHLSNVHAKFLALPPRAHSGSSYQGNANGTPGVDSLTNWNGSFKTPGFDPNGKYKDNWIYNMVGNPPQKGGRTNKTG